MKEKFFLTIGVILLSLILYFKVFINEDNHKYEIKGNENNSSESENDPGCVPADNWFATQRAFPFDEIPQEEYLKSVEYVKNQMSVKDWNGSENSAEWTLAGPTNIEGRITTIAIHPTNHQIVYIGTSNGGAWKSTNFCQSLVSIFDNQNTSSIGAIAIDPINPEIIYCGTGEANSLRSYYPGTGIYKSTNGGSNWAFIGLDSSYTIGNIAINPTNSQEIFVASGGWTRRKNLQRGIYKSINGGLNWTRKFFISDSVSAIDVAIDPNNTTKIFAAMWERQRREDYIKYGGRFSGLHVSTNSGENWSQIGGGFPINDANLGRISLDISKSNSQIIYALIASASGASRGLYKSVNGGTNWTQINPSVGGSSNYAWFNRICKVAPDNPDKVFCGGLEMELSFNGGTSFGIIANSHVDQHTVAFSQSNPNYIVTGNDGGIDYTTDGGGSWLFSQSLPITQFYAGEIDNNNPNTILGGTQDNGTIRTNGTSGNWNEIYGGDGFYCLVDYSNSQRVYASSQSGGLARSIDGGSSFLFGGTGLDIQYTNWMTPYAMDKNNPLTLYCGTFKIYKSTNGMESWSAISPDLANAHIRNLGTITTVDVAKSDPNVIYCGTDDANVWITTNGGTNWEKVNSGLPYRWVTRVAIHPDSANVCYVTLSGYKVDSTGSHIFRTTNYGANWISIKGNLPDAPINDVVIDPENTNNLFIGTDIAVMFTTNLGLNWFVLGSGIPPNVTCHDLTLHNPTRTLVVWTHGRSAYKIEIPKLVEIENNNLQLPATFKLEQNYPNPFNPVTRIKFEIPVERIGNPFYTLAIYDIAGRELEILLQEKLQSGSYEVKWNASSYSSGIYFYSLYADNKLMQTRKMILLK
ncbi:MAG: T9SS type A sorting domain-containing protein [Bacteroidota bacterium]|nr:T9SS type A sorting domain-containing protein [Bacteroidota bacterium]